MTTKPLSKRARVSHVTTAKVISLILDGPFSARDIVDTTGLHIVTAYELLRVLRKEKVIHISAWEPDSLGRDAIAIFSIGNKRDAKRRALTRAQISERYRARKRMRSMMTAISSKPIPDTSAGLL